MSTPATVSFRENGSEMVSLYCHWDGYPSGFGAELADFFKGITVVNGFNASQELVSAVSYGEEIFKGDIYEFWEFCRADEEQ